jgi:hypothetical protein
MVPKVSQFQQNDISNCEELKILYLNESAQNEYLQHHIEEKEGLEDYYKKRMSEYEANEKRMETENETKEERMKAEYKAEEERMKAEYKAKEERMEGEYKAKEKIMKAEYKAKEERMEGEYKAKEKIMKAEYKAKDIENLKQIQCLQTSLAVLRNSMKIQSDKFNEQYMILKKINSTSAK